MVNPGREVFPAGAVVCSWRERTRPGSVEIGKRTCKPNSVVCGHSSRRRVAADVHQRPTRRFRHCIERPVRAPYYAKSRLKASGRCPAPPGSWRTLPSLFGLAPCGVYPAPGVTAGAVRSYRTFSPLPRRWNFRNGGRTRQARPTRVLRFQGGPPTGPEKRARKRGSRGGLFSVALAVHGP